MEKENIRLIIFDMDGVVLNSEPFHEIARQAMYKRMGIRKTADFPEPVAPATSRCGILWMSETMIFPAMSRPTPNGILALL